MDTREIHASGTEALSLATKLLQRARLAHPEAGVWEAADVQWWWRTPRQSDHASQLFWIDEQGPVAGVLLTSWSAKRWQCDPIIVPGLDNNTLGALWQRALVLMTAIDSAEIAVPVRNDDQQMKTLVTGAGFTRTEKDHTSWLNAAAIPAVATLGEGFQVVDRTRRCDQEHPLAQRNGADVAERLRQVSLYDPALDLAVETDDGEVAGYSLYWYDPVTRIGLVEPVRVEDDFQRRGLARAMLSIGIDRLVKKGAERIKVSYENDAAGKLYESVGFRLQSSTTWYRAPVR